MENKTYTNIFITTRLYNGINFNKLIDYICGIDNNFYVIIGDRGSAKEKVIRKRLNNLNKQYGNKEILQ